MNTRDVVKRIYDYADVVQKKNDEYFTRNGFTHSPSDKIEVKLGRKYAKVIKLSRHYVAQTSDKVIETRSGGSVHGLHLLLTVYAVTYSMRTTVLV